MTISTLECKHTKGTLQRAASKFWAPVLLVMVFVTPWLVLKSYRELKEK